MEEVLQQHTFEIITEATAFQVDITPHSEKNGIFTYKLTMTGDGDFMPAPVTLRWKTLGLNAKGIWKPTTDFNKRIMADWELDHMESRISVDSPVIGVFGHDDQNVITFACSDAINTTRLNTLYREEDNYLYSHITFFPERHHSISSYETFIRIDESKRHFSNCLKDVAQWWAGFDHLKPSHTPELAKVPVYSTWYNFHQELDTKVLLGECTKAKELGYELIILDDGWQTNDSNRGYDYTGDWRPERIPEMAEFVKEVHHTGMKIALWYSVPFCGKESDAYKRFEGKFLTEEHRWAPVFDPRYPEVREYLIDLYKNALLDWNLDGFKLDFIDEFKTYGNTKLTMENGRDFSSVNEAVDRLMTDVINTLHAINPNCVIEFRQKYVGPAMRKYGNMFRAFDCPGDAVMNRIRIADLRMMSGTTATHADMFTYHPTEGLEQKSLQLINSLFGVPQLSIKLSEATPEEINMLRFYTQYWNENKSTLLEGDITPFNALGNYPIIKAVSTGLTVIGVYDKQVVSFEEETIQVDILNARIGEGIVLESTKDYGDYICLVQNVEGATVHQTTIHIQKGITHIAVPSCGIIRLKRA
ncbi:glycoside hydrolase family 36 protein [Dokdonia donghaensis]|uniref:glycoside hydrolase family 36 protein n=1 Tax=Dokdonia donghaensis TaxID=326320 RepID=UPI00068E1E17|nr:glycoside hydrolase family 36 protein [Dokdonia donghaensis]ANH60100.1 Melibiase [Dokdonia donghaensis DSW-1]